MKKLYAIFLAFAVFLTAANVAVLDNSKVTGYDIRDNADNYLEIDFNVAELTYSDIETEQGVFTKLNIDNGYLTKNEGEPALPSMHELIAMPYGAEPQVEVLSYEKQIYTLKELGIENPVFPAQPSYSKSSKPEDRVFVYNESAYKTSGLKGEEIAVVSKSGTMRGIGIGQLKVRPFRYDPVAGTIEVLNNLKIRVNFVGSDPRAEDIRAESYSPYFESAYGQLINYKESAAKADLMSYPVTYLIVASDQLQGNTDLQRLIDWKTEKGFNIVVSYVSSASSIFDNDTWVEQQWNNLTPKPSFVLLVGDMDGSYVVGTESNPPLGSTGNVTVSDLEYGVIGATGSSNRIPSMYVGRMSVRSNAELTAQVDKTIWYEKEQFTTGADLTYLTRPLGVAGVDGSFAESHGNPQISYGWTHYFTSANAMGNSLYYLYPESDATGVNTEVIDYISAGANFYSYTAHGMETSFGDPSFTISNIDGLANSGEYPLVVGNCCLTGSFGTSECFGEAWLNAADKGGIGYIGASMSTYWDEDLAMGVGSVETNQEPPPKDTSNPGMYDGVMELGYSSQSATKHVGLMAVEQYNSGYTDDYWSSYHLFGDPSLMVYFGTPGTMTATHDGVIAPGATTYSVTTTPYAYVAMGDQNGVLHGAARADASGVANVPISEYTVGDTGKLVITAQFKEPYFEDVLCTGDTGGSFSYSPASLDYGSVTAGSTSTQQFTITNSHSTEYLMGDITTITGYAASVSSKKGEISKDIKNTISYSVSPNSTKTFDLTFEPTAAGTYNGDITITSSDTNHATEYLAVTGTGITPDINLNPTSLSATAAPGESDIKTFDIENLGEGVLDYSMAINYTSGKEIKASGGPDTYGYKWKDSDEADGPVYNWVDISGSGTSVALGDDDISAAIDLGFTFNFYGNDFTTVKIGSNGYLSFTSTSTAYSNAAIPDSAEPNNLLALIWDDLNPSSAGSIYYYADTANNRFIVSYIGVPHYGQSDNNTVQVILYPSGKIIYQYQSVGTSTVSSCTVGIEDAAGSIGTQLVYNGTYLKSNLAVQFQATPEWLSLNTTSGSVAGLSNTTITATCDATELDLGTYTADVIVSSNDPDESTVTLPVTFTVTDTATPPSAPTLASPADASTTNDTTPTFDWSDVSTATSYTIQVDNNSNFSSPEIEETVSVSEYTPGTALAYDVYYWRVLATNAEGSSSYSNTWSLNIEAPLDPPNITLSAASITTSAAPEGTDTGAFDIGNTGEEDLTYDMTYEYVVAKADITVHSNNFESGLGNYTDNGVDINWAATGGQAVLNANTGGNPNGNSSATLTSDAFDGTQCTGLTFTFDQNFVNAGESSVTVEYYDGSAWNQIYSATASTAASQSLTLPNLSANMQIRFTGNLKNRSGDSWSIDNVVVYGPESGPGYTWLSIDSPTSGTVVPAGSNTINLTCDAAGLTDGVYNADITVASNDPDEPSKVLPVEFTVTQSTVIPGTPANVVTSIAGTDLVIDWDVSADATSYDVYSSDDPYGTFTFEANVGTNQYVIPYTEAKKFYYIVAKNATK